VTGVTRPGPAGETEAGPADRTLRSEGRADLATVLERIAAVEGWLSDAQARRLWSSASAVRAPGRIVEIGSFRGRSTIVLASAAAAGVEVIAIDPHGGGDRGPQQIAADAGRGEEDFAAFHANLRRAGVDQRVRHVRAPSLEALDAVSGAVDLLYVDGAHRYFPARADIERWGARVAPGGTMLIHDSFNAVGVTLAQIRQLFLSTAWRYRGRSGSLAEYRRAPARPDAAGATIAVTVGALRQVASLPYFTRNMVVKVLLVAHLAPVARLLGSSGEWPY
jgi:predicted O-methyltransferase YrrM